MRAPVGLWGATTSTPAMAGRGGTERIIAMPTLLVRTLLAVSHVLATQASSATVSAVNLLVKSMAAPEVGFRIQVN